MNEEQANEAAQEIMDKMEVVPNWKISKLLLWAQEHGLNLDRTSIDFDHTIYVPKTLYHQIGLAFSHSQESSSPDGAENFRNLKRAIDNFPATEPGQQARLEKTIEIEHLGLVEIRWIGAYTCRATSYTCEFNDFPEEDEG